MKRLKHGKVKSNPWKFVVALIATIFICSLLILFIEISQQKDDINVTNNIEIVRDTSKESIIESVKQHVSSPQNLRSQEKPNIQQNLRRGVPMDEEKTELHKSSIDLSSLKPSLGVNTTLLIICSKRPDYLEKTLSYVVQYHPGDGLPILISEDGKDPGVLRVIDEARTRLNNKFPNSELTHISHPGYNKRYENGYFKLSAHFKWALQQTFQSIYTKRVIILEEDLQISPDFFHFFAATKDLLDRDATLLAVSAWNDNGLHSLVKDPRQLYRSDFFPGLGWMLPRRVYEELIGKWPRAYWDDWLREPNQRMGRHTIRPEVCRTFHFGTHGVSNAQYSEYLNSIHLNDVLVDFTEQDLSYLEPDAWDRQYLGEVRAAELVTPDQFSKVIQRLKQGDINGGPGVKVLYHGLEGGRRSFPAVAHWAGAMDNIKAGVPRTAYKGIVSVWKEGVKLHLVPDNFR